MRPLRGARGFLSDHLHGLEVVRVLRRFRRELADAGFPVVGEVAEGRAVRLEIGGPVGGFVVVEYTGTTDLSVVAHAFDPTRGRVRGLAASNLLSGLRDSREVLVARRFAPTADLARLVELRSRLSAEVRTSLLGVSGRRPAGRVAITAFEKTLDPDPERVTPAIALLTDLEDGVPLGWALRRADAGEA